MKKYWEEKYEGKKRKQKLEERSNMMNNRASYAYKKTRKIKKNGISQSQSNYRQHDLLPYVFKSKAATKDGEWEKLSIFISFSFIIGSQLMCTKIKTYANLLMLSYIPFYLNFGDTFRTYYYLL